MLATLADRTLFAGDPKQLPAVVQSEHPVCQHYLGRTAFDVFDAKAPSVRLNEQSRMAPAICEVVSQVFYRGELVVATDKGLDPAWRKDREAPRTASGKVRPVRIVTVDEEAQWSSKYQGQIRYSSAIAAAAAVETFVSAGTAEDDIWVLTPFRAQRALMRNILHAKGRKQVQVSTVHRAQGGERRVVLFDPVDAASKFLNGSLGDKLINVALSRAMAHVSMFISEGDLGNPRVRQIVELVRVHATPGRGRKHISLAELLRRFGATPAAHGQTIAVGDAVGAVMRFEGDGQVIVIRCHESGRERRFKTRMAASG
jgi:superfamily I DNA and/or RNA helicase